MDRKLAVWISELCDRISETIPQLEKATDLRRRAFDALTQSMADPGADLVGARSRYRSERYRCEALLVRLARVAGGNVQTADVGTAERLCQELTTPTDHDRQDEGHAVRAFAPACERWERPNALRHARALIASLPETMGRFGLMRVRALIGAAFQRLDLMGDRDARELLSSLDRRTCASEVAALARLVEQGRDLARATFHDLGSEDSTVATVSRVLAERPNAPQMTATIFD